MCGLPRRNWPVVEYMRFCKLLISSQNRFDHWMAQLEWVRPRSSKVNCVKVRASLNKRWPNRIVTVSTVLMWFVVSTLRGYAVHDTHQTKKKEHNEFPHHPQVAQRKQTFLKHRSHLRFFVTELNLSILSVRNFGTVVVCAPLSNIIGSYHSQCLGKQFSMHGLPEVRRAQRINRLGTTTLFCLDKGTSNVARTIPIEVCEAEATIELIPAVGYATNIPASE